MQDGETKLNLIQKLAKIRGIANVAAKDKRGYGYTYADITQILANVTAGMKKYDVSLIPMIVHGTTSVTQNVTKNTKVDKSTSQVYDNVTTEMVVSTDIIFRWVDDETGESFDVPWYIVGAQADPSQAFGSGLTYCTRYFLTNFFQIAQTDMDVDAYRSKQQEAEAREEKLITEEIIRKLDSAVKKYLIDHQDKQEEVKKFMTRYAKNGNYLSIKDSKIAARLWNDFNENYGKEET